jgi:hypothetical protein
MADDSRIFADERQSTMAIIMGRAPEIMTIVSISFSRRKEIEELKKKYV